jgi:hypothetical protein
LKQLSKSEFDAFEEFKLMMAETVSKWSKFVKDIEADRISYYEMMGLVIEHTIYSFNPELLNLMNSQETHTPAFKEVLLQTMKDTIDRLSEALAQDNMNDNPKRED